MLVCRDADFLTTQPKRCLVKKAEPTMLVDSSPPAPPHTNLISQSSCKITYKICAQLIAECHLIAVRVRIHHTVLVESHHYCDGHNVRPCGSAEPRWPLKLHRHCDHSHSPISVRLVHDGGDSGSVGLPDRSWGSPDHISTSCSRWRG